MSKRHFNRKVLQSFRSEACLSSPLFRHDGDPSIIEPCQPNSSPFFGNDVSEPMPTGQLISLGQEDFDDMEFPQIENFSDTVSSVSSEESVLFPTYNNELPAYDSIKEALYTFKVLFSVSDRAMSFLLTILNHFGLEDCPKTLYHLRKDAKQCHKLELLKYPDANSCYISIEENLKYLVEKGHFGTATNLNLQIKMNVDGLPLFKSSKSTLWPFLMEIVSPLCSYTKPLPVALIHGMGKPDLSSLVSHLSNEILALKTDALVFMNKTLKIDDVFFTCDAPARAQIMNVKYHSGYGSCHICRIEGEYIERCVAFPFDDYCAEREDEKYKSGQESNQSGISELTKACNFINSFPIDYMHAVLLGSFKRLLSYFLRSQKSSRFECKIRSSSMVALNGLIDDLRYCIPSEFQRKVRNFSFLEIYKASELRQMLLYMGPIVLKQFLPRKYYEHFLDLHFAIYSLCSDQCEQFIPNAVYCIEKFCTDSERLFGRQNQTYNNHCLLHLPRFVQQYGALDRFSCFPFESYLYQLKNRTKPTKDVFKQALSNVFRIREMYSKVSESSIKLSNKKPNNCVILQEGVVVLIEKTFGNEFSGKQLLFKSNFYSYPYESRSHQIGIYSLTEKTVTSTSYYKKCVCFPVEADFYVVPYCSSRSTL